MAVKNLTEKMVARIRLSNGTPPQIVYYDGRMPNLMLEVGKKSKTFYWKGETVTGRRTYKLGLHPDISLEGAREQCIKTSEAVRSGKDPEGTDTDHMTGLELFEECIQSVQFQDRSESTVDIQESYLRRAFLPMCGKKLISQIHSGDVMDMIDVFLKDGKRGAAGHMRDSLAILFKYAIQRRYINLNPMSGITPPKPGKPRERVLTDSELKHIWFALDNTKRQPRQNAIAIRLLMLLPFRGVEVIGASWKEIDFERSE